MNLSESIRLAIDNIKINKMRSILTMLGIIIGIAAVITITTIGSSLKATIAATLNTLGGTSVIYVSVDAIYPETDEEWDTWIYPEMTEQDYLSLKELTEFKDAYPSDIKNISLQNYLGSATYTEKDNTVNVEIEGNTGGYLDMMRVPIIAGRDINLRDSTEEKSTALVSDLFVKYGCDDVSPIGKRLDLSLEGGQVISVYVVGVYEYDKQKFGNFSEHAAEKDITTPVYISYYAAAKHSVADEGVSYFQTVVNSGVDPGVFSEEIVSYFNDNKYSANDKFQVSTYDNSGELSSINSVLNVLTIAISVIAAISLIVGGIGVMNIMLVSVVERTREIGIRKALGARPQIIRRQFLMESVVICLIGGILGIIIGLVLGFLITVVGGQVFMGINPDVASFMEISFRPSFIAIIISVAFSMLIGIIFGSYPAKRAASLNPIDALRYE